MTEPTSKTNRWTHFRAWLSRQVRGHRKDTIAIVVLALAGIVMMLGIFTQQKASLPSWLPFVGEEFEHISAQFTTAQAVTPGQGQAVDIAGIQVGKVTSVDLEDGHAVVGMDIEPKYMQLIHPDASRSRRCALAGRPPGRHRPSRHRTRSRRCRWWPCACRCAARCWRRRTG